MKPKAGQVIMCDKLVTPETFMKELGEVDPDGHDQHIPGAKLDSGKPDASLLLMFGKALEAVAEVGTFGARKYSRGGWQQVVDGLDRYTAALLRHLFKEHYEKYDTDSKLLHAAQVAWNALARLELILRQSGPTKSIITEEDVAVILGELKDGRNE